MEAMNTDADEMECDLFINRPCSTTTNCDGVGDENSNDYPDERASTPPTNRSSTLPSELCVTPENTYQPHMKRANLYRNLFSRSKPRNSSSRHPHTLPFFKRTSQQSLLHTMRQCNSSESMRSRPFTLGPDKIPYEYINPFSPDAKLIPKVTRRPQWRKQIDIQGRKLNLNDSVDSDSMSTTDSEVEVPVRPRLSEFNVSRFNEEFVQLDDIGNGVHGCVVKCLNRMNGCLYAIKRTIKPIRSSLQERIIRNEIYAHGILDHQNIVRNYSCWKEEGYVYIQNEYCSGGSLEEYVVTNVLSEGLIRNLIFQMASALRYIHKAGLAHMDVKPGNILISYDRVDKETSFDVDSSSSDEEKHDDIVFKLGDFGHITRLDEKDDVEEGDCRYLAREILEENFRNLDRADIFALGLTVYEVSGAGPLPKNGDEWQDIRNGNVNYLHQHSKELNDIIKAMVQPHPQDRPSANDLMLMVKPNPPTHSPSEVFHYLQQYRHNNTRLEHKVETTGQYLRVLFKSHKQLQRQLRNGKEKGDTSGNEKLFSIGKKRGPVTKTQVVGKKSKRSSSTTTF